MRSVCRLPAATVALMFLVAAATALLPTPAAATAVSMTPLTYNDVRPNAVVTLIDGSAYGDHKCYTTTAYQHAEGLRVRWQPSGFLTIAALAQAATGVEIRCLSVIYTFRDLAANVQTACNKVVAASPRRLQLCRDNYTWCFDLNSRFYAADGITPTPDNDMSFASLGNYTDWNVRWDGSTLPEVCFPMEVQIAASIMEDRPREASIALLVICLIFVAAALIMVLLYGMHCADHAARKVAFTNRLGAAGEERAIMEAAAGSGKSRLTFGAGAGVGATDESAFMEAATQREHDPRQRVLRLVVPPGGETGEGGGGGVPSGGVFAAVSTARSRAAGAYASRSPAVLAPLAAPSEVPPLPLLPGVDDGRNADALRAFNNENPIDAAMLGAPTGAFGANAGGGGAALLEAGGSGLRQRRGSSSPGNAGNRALSASQRRGSTGTGLPLYLQGDG